MLRPQLQYERDGHERRLVFGLLRPNRTRKVYAAVSVRHAQYGNGFGVRNFTFNVSVFGD